MELIVALAIALLGIVIVWKLLKGAMRTLGLAAVAILIAGFVLMNGGFS